MKKITCHLITLALLTLSSVMANGQGLRLNLAWTLAPGDRPYLTTGTNQRGLTYNPVTGHLILVNRALGISVNVLDAATGDDVNVMDTSGVTNPGTFLLSKIGAADDGVIYAANFGTIGGATPTFTVYRWQDESSVCTIAYSADPGAGNNQQWGTTFDVRGAGTNTQILVSSSAGTIAALLTTTDGTNFSSQVISTDLLPGQMGIAVAFGASNTFWAKSVDGPLVHLSVNTNTGVATTLQNFSVTNFPGSVGPLGLNLTSNLLVGINVATPDTANLYSISNLAAAPVLLCSTNIPTDFPNTLFMGAVSFGNGMVFTLDSNNGLQGYSINPSADPVPPSIVYQPKSQTVFAGSTAVLVSSTAGTAPLHYQWQSNSVDILNATNAVLAITNAQAANDLDYDVVITNVAGTATSVTVHLTVLPPGVMTPIWSLAPGSRAYLTSSGNNQRGMAYNSTTKHVLLVNRAGTISVNILNATNGADIGTMNLTGVTGGTFNILMIGVADDGAIYAANFGTYNATAVPPVITTVYRWANEGAVPTIAFQGDPTGGIQNRQWGNALDVRGAGTNTQILLPSGGQQYVSILTTTNGVNYSSVLLSGIPTGSILEGAAFGAGDTFWGKDSVGPALFHFGFDLPSGTATVLETFDSSLFDQTVNPIAIETTHNLLAGVSIATPDTFKLYDISQLNLGTGPALLQSVKAPTDNANTLFRGALDFGDGMLFALDTNNGISAFALPFLNIRYVGGNVLVSWSAALTGFNLQSSPDVTSGAWTPVPGAVLNAGQYTVTLPATGSAKFFRLAK